MTSQVCPGWRKEPKIEMFYFLLIVMNSYVLEHNPVVELGRHKISFSSIRTNIASHDAQTVEFHTIFYRKQILMQTWLSLGNLIQECY